jgi:hypothetical protein
MNSSDFTGFGIVLELGLSIGLIVLLGGRRKANLPIAPIASPDQIQLQRQMFEQLQTLLVNYPTVAKAALAKPEMPARNIVPLFTPLGNLVEQWGYVAIGEPWESVAFDPQLHQADVADIQPGELVYVRFVGYRDGAVILVPAKVSRTLPQV